MNRLVRALKRYMADISLNVETLKKTFTPSASVQQDIFKTACKHCEVLQQWSSGISDNPEVYSWIVWPYTAYDAIIRCVALQGYTEMIMLVGSYTPEDERLIKDIVCQTKIFGHILRRFRKMPFPNREEQTVYSLTPHIISEALWPVLFLGFDKASLTLVLPERVSLPNVIYKHSILDIFNRIVEQFTVARSHQGLILLRLRPADTGVDFCLTLPHVHLTPQMWAPIEQANRPYIESLYEIGGSLEPLTWDEGAGQGFMIRLPWAQSSK